MTIEVFFLYMVGVGLLLLVVPLLFAATLALFGQIGSGASARVWGAAGVAIGLAFLWLGTRLMKRFGPW